MADQATAQGAAATAPQGQAGPSTPAPGGDPTNATDPQAPKTPVRAPEDDLWDRAMGKGAALRERDILRELGVASLDEAKTKLKPPALILNQAQGQVQGQGGKDYQALSRELQGELTKTNEHLEQLRAENARLSKWSTRALKGELIRELVEAGAHKDGVDILAGHLLPSLAWSDDGEAIEVVEHADGKMKPSRLSLKDLIKQAQKDRAFFFGGPAASGAGSALGEGSRPREGGAQAQTFDWRRAAQDYNKGRSA